MWSRPQSQPIVGGDRTGEPPKACVRTLAATIDNGVCLAYTSDHEGKGVQLRFALRDASLYSFWFEVPEGMRTTDDRKGERIDAGGAFQRHNEPGEDFCRYS